MVTSGRMPYLSLKAYLFSQVSTKLANLLILGNKKREEKEEARETGREDEENLDTKPTRLRRKVKKLTREERQCHSSNELLSPLILGKKERKIPPPNRGEMGIVKTPSYH